MSTEQKPSHKRKRSLQDSIGDLSKMLNSIEALKEELGEIKGTGKELQTALDHVVILETMVKSANKSRETSSIVTSGDLEKAGIRTKCLYFDSEKVTQLVEGMTMDAKAEIVDLHSKIKKIYKHLNMNHEVGSRMILDAILLALAEIMSDEQRGVVILPAMRIARGDGVSITHPVSGYELWLSGSVDYAILEYENVLDNKIRLLTPGVLNEDIFKITRGCLFLVEDNRRDSLQSLVSFIPKAVSQAIALLKSASLPEVRFCLSDGQRWIFFIVKLEDGTPICYDSAMRCFVLEDSDISLREIVGLLCEWVKPTMTGLFELEE